MIEVSRRSFLKGSALTVAAAAGMTALAACANSPSDEGSTTTNAADEGYGDAATTVDGLKDGTYTGTARGMGGDIDVTITVADGKIKVDSIGPNNETVGRGGYEAIEDGTFAKEIEDTQSADITPVSGATITSTAVHDAAQAAIDEAKAN